MRVPPASPFLFCPAVWKQGPVSLRPSLKGTEGLSLAEGLFCCEGWVSVVALCGFVVSDENQTNVCSVKLRFGFSVFI